MLRRLVCAAVAVLGLVLVPAALADGGPSPGVMMGGPGISSPDGNVRYTTLPGGSGTVIQAVRVRDAAVMRFTVLGGAWGIPMTTYGGSLGGLSADGRTIVLSDSTQCCGLKTETTFLALNAHTFRTRMLI